MISEDKLIQVQNYLQESNRLSGARFSALVFGNAFTNEEIFIGAGEGRPNQPISPEMYWRWASMTKLLGLITLGSLLEDGIIEDLETPVAYYLPEISQMKYYLCGAFPTGGVDKYGTPNYSMILKYEENLGSKITLNHLVQGSSGLGNLFRGYGESSEVLNSFAPLPESEKYIAFLQFLEKEREEGRGFISSLDNYYFGNEKNITETILDRMKYPLLTYPGEEAIYGVDWDFLGAVMSRALQMKGFDLTASEYTQRRIFRKLGMRKSWLGLGALSPPLDAEQNLTQSLFIRTNNLDGQRGSKIKYNRLYGSFDLQAEGDGFTRQANRIALKKKDRRDSLSGPYSSSGFGTLTDFAKLLKLLILKGQGLLQPETIDWILCPKLNEPLTSAGKGTHNFLEPNTIWSGALAKVVNSETYSWGGYFGTYYYFDMKTGDYIVNGCQVGLASWYSKSREYPFCLNTFELFLFLKN